MPGFKTFTSATLTSSDVNSFLMQQAVIQCTSSTRPTPNEGMAIWETDTNEFLIYNGVAWRRPWSQPWGIQGYAERTTQQTTITAVTDLTSLTVTWTAVANRRYRITAECFFFSSVANDIASLSITDPANAAQQLSQVTCTSTTAGIKAVCSVIQTPAAGSVTRKLRAARATGTGNITMDAGATFPAYIVVEDIGPNGVPA